MIGLKNILKLSAMKFPGLIPIARKCYNNKFINRFTRVKRNYPRIMNIELTNMCNAKCLYCGRENLIHKRVRDIKQMELGLFNKIVEDIKNLPLLPARIIPVGLGEAMLYDNLIEALSTLKSKLPAIEIKLSTNGIYFPRKIQQDLINIGLDTLVISINFYSKELYKKYNRVDKLEEVVSNVESFLALKGARKPYVTLQILDIAENKNDINKFIGFWKSKISPRDFVYAREFNDFCGTVDVAQYGIERPRSLRYPCAQIFDHLMINVDGDCFPCCMGINTNSASKLSLGNLKKHSINDLFTSDSHVQWIRRMHKEGKTEDIAICSKCNAWSYGPNMFYRINKNWI